MKLTGGINLYSLESDRVESEIPPNGRKVRFLNTNGFALDLHHARKYFKPNEILTVEEIFVGRASATVVFKGYYGRFNTVMFADVEETE